MTNIQLLLGITISVVAVLLGIYAFFAAKQKGPIFTNAYFWATDEQRRNIDKKKEYHLAAVIFGVLSLSALMEALYAFTGRSLFQGIVYVLLAVDIVYAIADAVKSERKKDGDE